MKSHFQTFLLLIATILPARAQETPAPTPPAAFKPFPEALTYIPRVLAVAPFTPPPPPVMKPAPPIRIDASVTRRAADSTRLTLQRGEPSTRPDLPPPPPPRPYVVPRELTAEEKARRLHQRRHSLNLGATIYDHRVSVVSWTDPGSREAYQAVCGFDVGLLAGVGRFIHRGEGYGISLMPYNYDTTRWRRLGDRPRPAVPEVAPGEIRITRGNAEDELGTAPITIVRDVIAAEKDRLIPYQAARDAYFKASRAWHAAHPPVPRDKTIILRPHRGSRYLKPQSSARP